jgi:hypothetical protein
MDRFARITLVFGIILPLAFSLYLLWLVVR